MFQHKTWSVFSNKLRKVFGVQTETETFPQEELEKLLYESDLPAAMVDVLIKKSKAASKNGRAAVLEALALETQKMLDSNAAKKLDLPSPASILLVGINGSGKTTTAARLASYYQKQGRNVLLAAADTFRAGAVEQLQEWGKKIKVEVIAKPHGSDPASVVFDAWAKARQADCLLIADTAGRIHTHTPLMDQLQKIFRSLAKGGAGAPHEVWLVLDGTSGQNAVIQSSEYLKTVPLTGLIVTKLDGTSKGGGAIFSSIESKLPIRFLGIGEKEEDLIEFNPKSFVKTFYGIQ